MKKTDYHPTKIVPIVQIITRIVKKMVEERPGREIDPDYLKATIAANIPGFWDKQHCINCGAGMGEYIRELDIFVALLLLNMAKNVRDRTIEGMPFTMANAIKVSASNIPHSQKCQTTNASKLGLIAKHLKGKKHHNSEWVITKRGWEALQGKPVPKEVRVFRNQILERTEEKVTLAQVFAQYREKVQALEKKGKVVKDDQSGEVEAYDHFEWFHVAGMNEGTLFGDK